MLAGSVYSEAGICFQEEVMAKKKKQSAVSKMMSKFAKIGGKAQKRKVSKAQLAEWGAKGAAAREAKKKGETDELATENVPAGTRTNPTHSA